MADRNYPHPVLSKSTDDFNPLKASFDIKVSKKIERMNYQLICSVSLKERNLESLLAEGKIAFLVKIICSATRYREVFQFKDIDYVIKIPATMVEKKVEIYTFIVATEKNESYFSKDFNEYYEGTSFIVYPGDVLAEGAKYQFKVDKKIDSLVKIPSIFTITYNNHKDTPPVDVNIAGEKIIVTLNHENFQKYKDLRELQNQYGHLAALTSSLFILPALVNVINDIRKSLDECNNDYETIKEYIAESEINHRWFKVINMKLQDKGILLNKPEDLVESSLVIAQKLLGDPISNGLQFFDEFLSSGEEDII
ncbi:hypothetical protein [Bacillus cereus]|uniref:Uncharacterized protein n=1 Tax=Bacillus cereus (strain AH820) TaxID=405535 RepID=B7JSJ7_BACC0|nr:hypothetical protein [Bacillus cereus]ACK88409.1 hypothetical protein BCAH820_1014 [Bacillus cereus AH820]MCQ0952982.1 hypothetical protein [Bacillus cereus]MDA1611197.1 hypothetical protein [Bacillus cereus]MDV6362998.1 hypothetical protein [Bacillus cereus]